MTDDEIFRLRLQQMLTEPGLPDDVKDLKRPALVNGSKLYDLRKYLVLDPELYTFSSELSKSDLRVHFKGGFEDAYQYARLYAGADLGDLGEKQCRTLAAEKTGTIAFVLGYLYRQWEENQKAANAEKPVVDSTHEQRTGKSEHDKQRVDSTQTGKNPDSETSRTPFRDAFEAAGEKSRRIVAEQMRGRMERVESTSTPAVKPAERKSAELESERKELERKWRTISKGRDSNFTRSNQHPMFEAQNVPVRGCVTYYPNLVISVSSVNWAGNYYVQDDLMNWKEEIEEYYEFRELNLKLDGMPITESPYPEFVNAIVPFVDDGRLLVGYVDAAHKFMIFNEAEFCTCNPPEEYHEYLSSRPSYVEALKRAKLAEQIQAEQIQAIRRALRNLPRQQHPGSDKIN